LIKKVEEVLIRDQLEAIYAEAKALLRDEKHQGKYRRLNITNNLKKCFEYFIFICFIDLALLFKLVSRVPNATLELKRIVEDHIRQMGTDAIERVSGTALNVNIILVFVFCSYLFVRFLRIQNSMLKQFLIFIQNFSNLYKKRSAVNKALQLLLTK